MPSVYIQVVFLAYWVLAGATHCDPHLQRVTDGLVALYTLDDGALDSSSNVAVNRVSGPAALPNLVMPLASSGLAWCNASQGICMTSSRPAGFGAQSSTLSLSSLQSFNTTGEITIELWFRPNKQSVPVTMTCPTVLMAAASWTTPSQMDSCYPSSTTPNVGFAWTDFPVPSFSPPFGNYDYETLLVQTIIHPPSVLATGGNGGVNAVENGSLPLHSLVFVSNRTAGGRMDWWLDGEDQGALNKRYMQLWTISDRLMIGPTSGTVSWSGRIELLAIYNRSLTSTERSQNLVAHLPNSPAIAQPLVLTLFEGTTAPTPLVLPIYDDDMVRMGCHQTLGATLLSLPSRGFLLLSAPGGGYNVLGLTPYTVSNLTQTLLAFWASSPTDFGQPYATFDYSATDNQPQQPTRPRVATVTVNIVPVDRPPVCTSASLTVYAGVVSNLTLSATDPDTAPNRVLLPSISHTITRMYLVSLPGNGTITLGGRVLTQSDLPVLVPGPPFVVNYTSFAPGLHSSGLSTVLMDAFQFTASDGQRNSTSPGTIRLSILNPLQLLPPVQMVRTGTQTPLSVSATNTDAPGAALQVMVVSLPAKGSLVFPNGTLVTAPSQVPVMPLSNPLPLLYQPGSNTAGPRADSLLLVLVNVTDGFESAPTSFYLSPQDPPVWIGPTTTLPAQQGTPVVFTVQLLGVGPAGDAESSTNPPPYSPLFGHSPPLQVTVSTSNAFLQVFLGPCPGYNNNASFNVGDFPGGLPELQFSANPSIVNCLLTNCSVLVNDATTASQSLTFTAQDTEPYGNFKSTLVVKLAVAPPTNPLSTGIAGVPPWLGILIWVIVGLAVCFGCLVCWYCFAMLRKLVRNVSKLARGGNKSSRKSTQEQQALLKSSKRRGSTSRVAREAKHKFENKGEIQMTRLY